MIVFGTGDVIDGRFEMTGICSDAGGMGTILHVKDALSAFPFEVVLKYCKMDPSTTDGAEAVTRFQREIRYLSQLKDNSRVVKIVHTNLAHDPPYFVMKFYPEGDLTNLGDRARSDPAFEEVVINKLLDCVGELHSRGMFHRDIKLENFLCDGEDIVISDLGLAKVPDAGTTFTKTHAGWGTVGYMPPEYFTGGFKEPDAQGDIYMLGKTIYGLDTGKDITYIFKDGVNPPLYHVIQRCCSQLAKDRYPSIAALRQDVKLAFDVILGRAAQIDKVRQMVAEVKSDLDSSNTFDVKAVEEMVSALAMLDESDRAIVFHEWPGSLFKVIGNSEFAHLIGGLLDQYREFVLGAVNQWSYAETVAVNMRSLFGAADDPDTAVRGLEIAIEGAIAANRFAAMDTCSEVITSVIDDELAKRISALVLKFPDTFVTNIEPSTCKNLIVATALRAAKKAEA